MAKPEVQISSPTTLVVGQQVTIDVDVTAARETKVDFIEATLEGRQGWTIGSGKSQVSARAVFPRLVSQLMGAGVLPAATTTRFAMRFVLPPGTAPTHDLDPAEAELRMRIHISIPWRIDGRYHYKFHVRLPPPAHVERKPLLIRSTSSRDPADKPRIELALASSRLIAGEICVGSIAVFHLDDRKPRDVELSFVPMMLLHGRGRARDRRGRPYTVTMTLPAGSAGTSVPFQIQLPKLVPTFTTVTHQLAWWLVAQSGSLFGKKVDVSVPLEIVDAAAAATTPRLVAAPRLGDERIATLFATAAAGLGWRGAEFAADHEGQFGIAYDAPVGELSLAYAYRGQEGTFVVARIEHPTLGLALGVAPSSTLRHVFWKDVEVDIDVWDRANHVGARSAPQAIPFLQSVVPALMKAGRLGAMVRWDDGAMSFERAMSAIDEAELRVMAAELALVGDAIHAARPLITPPPNLTVDVAAWQALATKLDGTLSLGDLSITGALDQLPVALSLEWEGERPVRIRVAIGDEQSASEEVRRLAFALPRPASDVLGEPAANAIVEAVTRWPSDLIDLRIENGVASAGYVLDGVADATRVRELVEALRGVLVALSPATGPYR